MIIVITITMIMIVLIIVMILMIMTMIIMTMMIAVIPMIILIIMVIVTIVRIMIATIKGQSEVIGVCCHVSFSYLRDGLVDWLFLSTIPCSRFSRWTEGKLHAFCTETTRMLKKGWLLK